MERKKWKEKQPQVVSDNVGIQIGSPEPIFFSK